MILIGMLHHRRDPKSVRKSYAYASVARSEGADLLFFSPKKVDFENKLIYGYKYRRGKWIKVSSRFPDVIYNAGSPEKLKKSEDIVNQLKETIPFTTFSIGNKMRVYKRLVEDGEFKNYLIPSQVIYSIRRFIEYLRRYKKIVFKPVNGHKGQGITFIEPIRDEYQIQSAVGTKVVSYEELIQYVSEKIKEESYLVQPYIKCLTKSGNAYDFRLHTQKNEQGEWVINTIYPRIGPSGSIVSNISTGGATNYLEPFLIQEFGDDYFNVKRYLEYFSIQLSKKMDEIQMNYFNETIDELGIDVGLDDLQKIWIYEVNWRPGCPPAFYLELDVVKNLVRYAILLAKKKKNQSKEVIL